MDEFEQLLSTDDPIGITDELHVYSGYDTFHQSASASKPEFERYGDSWQMPPEEKRTALADKMIALWTRYKELQ